MDMNDGGGWIQVRGRHPRRCRQPEQELGAGTASGARTARSYARGLSRRDLARRAGALGLLLAGARLAPSAAAQGTQPGQCGGDPGVEALLARSQGTIIPQALFAADPRWPVYMNPASPVISFRYPPGWQPVDLPSPTTGVVLYSPQEDALVTMGSAQGGVYVPMEELLAGTMQAVFAQFLRQPVGQNLCVYPLTRSALGETDFAAAQNRTTLAAVSVSGTYSEGVTLDANSNLIPTTNTIAVFYAVAGPKDQFAELTETVFFPIFGQLLMTGGGTGDPDDDEDGDDGW
jgi:hypothetical protein